MDDLADYLRESLVSAGYLTPGDVCRSPQPGSRAVVAAVTVTLDHAGRTEVRYTVRHSRPGSPVVHECDEAALEGEDDGGVIVRPGSPITLNTSAPQF